MIALPCTRTRIPIRRQKKSCRRIFSVLAVSVNVPHRSGTVPRAFLSDASTKSPILRFISYIFPVSSFQLFPLAVVPVNASCASLYDDYEDHTRSQHPLLAVLKSKDNPRNPSCHGI